ncbi:MAG: hypothetical protein JNK87_12290 [Bryobacterales bacterium]|nr:hypothetical protein [Bryobacterales bacterium]
MPQFTRRELAASLELQAAGDIQFRHKRRRLRSATADELETGILGALPLLYSVTQQGGERWARLCRVDWRQWVERDDEEITSGDPEVTAFWFEVARRWADVVAESVKWEEVRPWRPLHWHEEAVAGRRPAGPGPAMAIGAFSRAGKTSHATGRQARAGVACGDPSKAAGWFS